MPFDAPQIWKAAEMNATRACDLCGRGIGPQGVERRCTFGGANVPVAVARGLAGMCGAEATQLDIPTWHVRFHDRRVAA